MVANNKSGALLITGSNGFLGSSVMKALIANPWTGKIYLAGRNKFLNLRYGQENVSLDLLASTISIPDDVETVLHIAGEKKDFARMDEVNHLGTQRLANAASTSGARRFVYISSVGSYGAAPYIGNIDERHPHTPRNQYEKSKNDGEAALRLLGAKTGLSIVVVQPTNVIGLSSNPTKLPLLGLMRMISKGRFFWFGDSETWVNYVSADDVAAAALQSCYGVHSDTFIINTPAKLSDLVGWVCEELDYPLPQFRLPLNLAHAAAVAGSALQKLSGISYPLNKERFMEMTNTNYYDPSHFIRVMQFDYPVGIEKQVRLLASTYRERGLL